MDTMQFAKYSCDIREILSKVDQEGLENLVRNAVAYAQSNNNGKANWIAQELFADVIPDELIAEIFNEKQFLMDWRYYMYCVVLSKIKDIYTLRHIIYDVDKNDSLNIIKEKYYADYNKTSTDEFHLCQTKTEVSDILSALKISH